MSLTVQKAHFLLRMNAWWILKDSSGGGGGAILGQAMRRAGQGQELDGVHRGSAGGAFLGQGAATGGAL